MWKGNIDITKIMNKVMVLRICKRCGGRRGGKV
jgi:hypothetical protein